MELFWKCVAGVLIAAILGPVLGQQEKGISVMLSVAVCAMGAVILLSYLEPVLDLLRQLESLGDLGGEMLTILLKAMGIALVAELAGLICTDAGSGALGKTIQMLASAVILWLSIPVFQAFLSLIRQILGEV